VNKSKVLIAVNGGLEYPMLVKHGEDVRQDERIMQLLNIIDVSLARDQECRKRNLQIRTYEVIISRNVFNLPTIFTSEPKIEFRFMLVNILICESR